MLRQLLRYLTDFTGWSPAARLQGGLREQMRKVLRDAGPVKSAPPLTIWVSRDVLAAAALPTGSVGELARTLSSDYQRMVEDRGLWIAPPVGVRLVSTLERIAEVRVASSGPLDLRTAAMPEEIRLPGSTVQEPLAADLRATIEVMSPSTLRQSIQICGETVIGRFPGDGVTVLAHSRISGRHALVRVRSTHVDVEDLRSTNGTRINGTALPLDASRPLYVGDQLQVADVCMVLRAVSGGA